MTRDIVERLTAILHDPDLATRLATPHFRLAVEVGELTPIEPIQWVGKEYRLARGNQFFTFTKTPDDTWALVADPQRYATTWSITVRGVFAELTRAVTRRHLGALLLLGTGLGAGITAEEWGHLLTRLTPVRPLVHPLAALLPEVPAAPCAERPPASTPVVAKPQRHAKAPAPAATQPNLFGEVA